MDTYKWQRMFYSGDLLLSQGKRIDPSERVFQPLDSLDVHVQSNEWR